MKNKRIQLIIHKGKTIIYINYQGFSIHTKKEFMNTIEEAAELMIQRGKGQRTLTDVRNTYGDSDTFAKFREVAARTEAYRKKAAVLGVTGIKAVFLKGLNMVSKNAVKPFDDMEKAKDWLVQD